ncbi:MAG: bifunctional diaminohydroxyphosphoribosylaminopyrimidine deaminase/5-amino-6-(5-phosphoribosylamino)uracil reductase RibD [Pontibacterium sp.]
MSLDNQDRAYMARAIQLAKKGRYTTSPNPNVGCVIVRDGCIVGEGYHYRAGEPHAEVHALAQAGEQAKGATAYVTLEPCSHYGRTPPCAKALTEAGVARVVAAMVDPNPQVAGRGLRMLADAGIEVSDGLLAADARALNPGFIKRMETGLPYVTLKTAISLDGRTAMANGESFWITGEAARSDVQRERAASCAILTGAGTVEIDDPALTVRASQLGLDNADDIAKRQPLRVILDSRLRTSPVSKVVTGNGSVLIVTTDTMAKTASADTLRTAGVEIVTCPHGETGFDLEAVLVYLANHKSVNSLLVEAGAQVCGSFVRLGLVDELLVYQAPVLMGSDARPMLDLPFEHMIQRLHLALVDSRMVGQDLRRRFKIVPASEE